MKSRKMCQNLRKSTGISNSPLIDVVKKNMRKFEKIYSNLEFTTNGWSQEKYAKNWENLQ